MAPSLVCVTLLSHMVVTVESSLGSLLHNSLLRALLVLWRSASSFLRADSLFPACVHYKFLSPIIAQLPRALSMPSLELCPCRVVVRRHVVRHQASLSFMLCLASDVFD